MTRYGSSSATQTLTVSDPIVKTTLSLNLSANGTTINSGTAIPGQAITLSGRIVEMSGNTGLNGEKVYLDVSTDNGSTWAPVLSAGYVTTATDSNSRTGAYSTSFTIPSGATDGTVFSFRATFKGDPTGTAAQSLRAQAVNGTFILALVAAGLIVGGMMVSEHPRKRRRS